MINSMTSNASGLYQAQREFAPKQVQKTEPQETKSKDKLEEMKESVQNGTYKVDIDKTAKAMLDYLA